MENPLHRLPFNFCMVCIAMLEWHHSLWTMDPRRRAQHIMYLYLHLYEFLTPDFVTGQLPYMAWYLWQSIETVIIDWWLRVTKPYQTPVGMQKKNWGEKSAVFCTPYSESTSFSVQVLPALLSAPELQMMIIAPNGCLHIQMDVLYAIRLFCWPSLTFCHHFMLFTVTFHSLCSWSLSLLSVGNS